MKAKKVSTARHNIRYTKKYANKGNRRKVIYEHLINEEINLRANPTGFPKLRRSYC